MAIIEKDPAVINEQAGQLFKAASLVKFSYSGIFSLEFELPREYFGFNHIHLDIGTRFFIYGVNSEDQFETEATIQDLYHIWSKNVSDATIGEDLSLNFTFENNRCLRVVADLHDPDKIFDMRWEIYQRLDDISFRIRVSDEKTISMQLP